jgi:hypothetical protein
MSTCPHCDKEFFMGRYHGADQKLYDHMRMFRGPGKQGHREYLNEIDWQKHTWINDSY